MSLTDSVHRKNKSEIENKKDLYQTPPCVTECLIEGMKGLGYLSNEGVIESVLDPCCGDLAITRVLKKQSQMKVTAYDLFSNAGDKKVDFLKLKGEHYDMVIMNPPYSAKNSFIDKALEIADFVFVLMPSNVDNYTIMNQKYFDRKEYIGSIRTYPKFFMEETLGPIKWGGMSTYTWYCFSSDPLWHEDYKGMKFEMRKDIRKYIDK